MIHRPHIWGAVLFACLSVATWAPVRAQQAGSSNSVRPVAPETQARPRLRASPAKTGIILDGILDEAAWLSADTTDGVLWTTQPVAGVPAPDRTVIRIVYDHEALYVGARLYDSEPQRAVSAGLEQDFAVGDSDLFGVAIDAARDMQSAFTFAANPAGATWDAQSFGDGATINAAWEGIFEVETTIDEEGWIMEMRIPFSTLRFPAGEEEQIWGLNFSRQIKRRNEYATWAPITRQSRVFRVSMAGTLEGLPPMSPGRNLQIKPFVIGSRNQGQLRPEGTAQQFDVGLDAKWAVAPQLTLDLTALTDFSQVEADAEQINLTRFSVFFPEKRDFFLENDGIFTFADDASRAFRSGSGPQTFKLFHSRRIGLSDARQPLPIGGGARLSGRIGRYDLGVMNMQTLQDEGQSAENFAVARLRRSFLTSSDVGVMFVNRQATGSQIGDSYSRAGGIDANFRLARLQVNSYVALSDDPGSDGDRSTGMLQLGWRDRTLDFSIMGKHVGEDFSPGAGFVSRAGMNQWFASGGVHVQQPTSWLTELNPYLDITEYYAPSGGLESREIQPGVAVIAVDGGRVTAEYSRRTERFLAPESLLGVTLPAGYYEFGATSLGYTSNSGRILSGSVSMSSGEFFDGDRTSITSSLSFRPNEHLVFQGTFQRNRLTLAGQPIEADLLQGRIRYGFTTKAFASAFVQYNRVAQELISNVRFNLIHAPLSDIFVVLSDRRRTGTLPGERSVLDQGITIKVTRLLQF
jgi:hypothetical protein